MTTRDTIRQRVATSCERGAVLVLTGMSLVLLLVAGGLAVDLSALDARGQTLQNTADAASLAGVAVWAETLDEDDATATIERTIELNGIEIGDEVQVSIEFPTFDSVTVELTDVDPDVLLGGVLGFGSDVTRNATSRLRSCEVDCGRTVELPPPFQPLQADGDGDGFLPIVVGDRIYAINHGNNRIHCVDQTTSQECWPSKQLFPHDDDATTMVIAHHYLLDGRIYYVVWEGETEQYSASREPQTFLNLTCWDTRTDTPCTQRAEIRNAGQGIMAGTPNGIYVFAGNLKTHCYEPPSLEERCPGYGGGGRVEELRKEGRGFRQWWSNRMTTGDYVFFDDRIYFTASREDGMVWLACWATNRECRGFDAPPVNDTGSVRREEFDDLLAGRLFLHRDTNGEPDAVCTVGARVRVECYDPYTAERVPSAEANMAITTDNMRVDLDGRLLGVMTYHPATNRLFLVSDIDNSTTYCHDFTTRSYCGSYYTDSPWGPTLTYGYDPQSDCLIGLGHAQIFFTLDPDMSGECTGTDTEIQIDPCRCGEEVTWPPIATINTEGLATFEYRILDPDGVQLVPADGDSDSGVPLGPDGTIDLSEIDIDLEYVTLAIYAEAAFGENPWAPGEQPPTVVIGIRDRLPRLVE